VWWDVGISPRLEITAPINIADTGPDNAFPSLVDRSDIIPHPATESKHIDAVHSTLRHWRTTLCVRFRFGSTHNKGCLLTKPPCLLSQRLSTSPDPTINADILEHSRWIPTSSRGAYQNAHFLGSNGSNGSRLHV